MNGTGYHWIITLQWGNGFAVTADGVTRFEPGTTRSHAYQLVRSQMAEDARRKHGLPGGPVVVFFALEPDVLAGES